MKRTRLRSVGRTRKKRMERYKQEDWPLIVKAIKERDEWCRFRFPGCTTDIETAGHLVYPDEGKLVNFAGTCHSCNSYEHDARLTPERPKILAFNAQLLADNQAAA